MKAIWEWFSGKKRTFATIGGVALAWAWKYEVAPEMYLDLANMVYTAFGLTALGHAAVKSHATKSLLLLFTLFIFSASPHAQTPTKLLGNTDLTYKGAFRVPEGELSSGGSALAISADGKSFFITSRNQKTAELSIPAVRNGVAISGLAIASIIQPFADATEGRLAGINPGDPNAKLIGGALVYGDKLLLTGSTYYDANGSQVKSHFISGLNLSASGDIKGPYQVGNIGAGFVSGYMGLVPPEWRPAFGAPAVTGQCCIPIISRTSAGPALSLFDPDGLSDQAASAKALPLVYYDLSHQTLGAYESSGINLTYNGTSSVGGVVWPSGTASILFIGSHGVGPWCYGDGAACGDKADGGSKGTHAYPYKYQVWAYNANDLLSVKNGIKKPWDPKPYAVWNFNLPYENDDMHRIGGVAYDHGTKRVYLAQLNKDDGKWGYAYLPIIHVFEINDASSVVIPPPPKDTTPPVVIPPPPRDTVVCQAVLPCPPPPRPDTVTITRTEVIRDTVTIQSTVTVKDTVYIDSIVVGLDTYDTEIVRRISGALKRDK